MNFEQLLERHLDAVGAELPEHADNLARVVTHGRRRRLAGRAIMALGSAAAIAITVFVATTILPGTNDDVANTNPIGTSIPTAVTTTPATTTPVAGSATTYTDAVLLATENGVTVLSPDGKLSLPGDRYFEQIRSVQSDGQGGLLLVHDVTPLPWTQGSIVRIPAGSDRPVAIVDGPEVLVDGVTYVTERRLVGLFDGGFAFADWTWWSDGVTISVSVAGPDGGNVREVWSTLVPVGSAFSTPDVAVGGNVIAVLNNRNPDCWTIELFDLNGRQLSTIGGDCGLGPIDDIDISPDGQRLVALGTSGLVEDRGIAVFDTATGETLSSINVDAWGVAWRSNEQAIVNTFDGVGLVGLATGDVTILDAATGWLSYATSVTLAEEAGTGSGSGALPCQPQDLAEPLDSTWMTEAPSDTVSAWSGLRAMAASCDFAGLSERASGDQTSLSFGGAVDLTDLWIRSARLDYDYREQFLEVTALRPAALDAGDGTTIWVWPAVAATNSDADWQELVDSGYLTAEQAQAMRDFGGYIDYRVGITTDGVWSFAIAGD